LTHNVVGARTLEAALMGPRATEPPLVTGDTIDPSQ